MYNDMFRNGRDPNIPLYHNSYDFDTINCKEFPPTDEFHHGTLI